MRAISVDFRPPSAVRTTAVAMGLLAAAGIAAPAAMAAEDDSPDEATTTVPEADTVRSEVLTPTPAPSTIDEETDGPNFGLGKIGAEATVAPDVVFAEDSSFPAGAVLERTGATMRLTYLQWEGNDTSDVDLFPDGPPELTCTWDELDDDDNGNLCDFTGDAAYITSAGEARLAPFTAFTIELTGAPNSGQVLLPAAPDRVLQGSWLFGPNPLPMVFEAPGAYRPIGVTLTGAGGAAVAGATFELCTQPGGACAPGPATSSAADGRQIAAASAPVVSSVSSPSGLLVFPGLYLPGDYQIRQTASADGRPFSTAPIMLRLLAAGSVADTSAPVLLPVSIGATASAPASATPSAAPVSAPAAEPVAAPATSGSTARLASTGAEPLPVLALGAGLVLVGGAVTVAAARRRTR
ncbi:hypothetical protein SAMN05660485_02859 [Blastococcus fimeti]|nr:hypothetical protein SAMN05660485_02859 [Blastococcus fimeti]